jgi:hypothetical protein
MAEPKFKIGDKVRPLKKGISNYYLLKDLFEVEILNSDIYPTLTKKMVKVKVLKGVAVGIQHHSSCKYTGDEFPLYEDALELIIPEGQDYDIF